MASAMHIQVAPTPCIVGFLRVVFCYKTQKDKKSMKRKQGGNAVCVSFNGCKHLLILFEEINFLEFSLKILDMITVS